MNRSRRARLVHFLTERGMGVVLLLLCIVLSALTYAEQRPTGASAARRLAKQLKSRRMQGKSVLIAATETDAGIEFADQLKRELEAMGCDVRATVTGKAIDARSALEALVQSKQTIDVIACSSSAATFLLWDDLGKDFPTLATATVVAPERFWWPSFLMWRNLRNIAEQIAVIAIVAIGMTMVIISGGIDLSVGSLIALSAVVTALLIRYVFGARDAGTLAMIFACVIGIAACGLMGAFSGVLITSFRMPPFIVTLAVMLVASGTASRLTAGESVYQIPDSFTWLGRGADLFGIPNAVVLMLVLYAAAQVLMTRMTLGRYLYAVGGNEEAARLSGVPIRRVILFAYVCSGLLAGLGGVIMASQLRSASPTYGTGYELQVIAAVVVGGTSLSGGEGRMLGTLMGALIIAVIQNGMNLTNVNPFTQKIVLGSVILVAVLLDRLKRESTVAASAGA